jgi:hypothetical protein
MSKESNMIIRIDDTLAIDVSFSKYNREPGFPDDIRFALCQSGSKDAWLFPADETNFLLTPDQAEMLASALQQAAAESRAAPSNIPGETK